MNTIKEQWEEAQETEAFGTVITWRLRQQVTAQRKEREAYHAMMELIAPALRDKAVELWVQGTTGASDEAYNRMKLKSELSETEYLETQSIVHDEWMKVILNRS